MPAWAEQINRLRAEIADKDAALEAMQVSLDRALHHADRYMAERDRLLKRGPS